ncbi:MAG: tyrosine-type recombinase/integrase [Steroidobacteraceae bacterium]
MLSDIAVKAAKPRETAYKLFDERGLYLHVAPAGGRWWRLRYAIAGRAKLLSLGTYPDVTLKRARQKRDEARRLIADGIDPSVERKAQRAAQADSFTALATEWLEMQSATLTEGSLSRTKAWLDFVARHLGSRPVRELTAPELLAVLRKVEARGRTETARRTASACGRLFRYAVATGRAERDITQDLKGALAPTTVKNFAAVTEPAKVGQLLRAIDGYQGQPSTEYALRLAPLVFVRPGELRGAEWAEFDLHGEHPHWRIRAERMKMGREHVVPLARQAVALLNDLHPITGGDRYLFPSLTSAERPISENTVNAALRRLGYSHDQHVGHGFRSMASTLLNELGWHPDLIELQLAHQERNKIRAAYNRAQRLAERREMMQAWADYLDGLRTGARVVALHRHAK